MSQVVYFSEPLYEVLGSGYPASPPNISGDAVNAACAHRSLLNVLAKLRGHSTHHQSVSILSATGNDAEGDTIRQFLKSRQVDVENLLVIEGCQTAGYRIDRIHERDHFTYLNRKRAEGAAATRLFEDSSFAQVQKSCQQLGPGDALVLSGIGLSRLVEGISPDEIARVESQLDGLLASLKNRGVFLVVNTNFRPALWLRESQQSLWSSDRPSAIRQAARNASLITRVWQYASVVFLSSEDADSLLPNVDPRELASALHQQEVLCLVYTDGENGATLFDAGDSSPRQVHVPAVPLPQGTPLYTTGAGDTLVGATLSAWQLGYELDAALRVGSLAASRVVQHPGGVLQQHLVPTAEEIDQTLYRSFLANQQSCVKSLEQTPFVAVFQAITHRGHVSILSDALAKTRAIYAGGVRHFEFLLRGDETLSLHDYVTQVMAAIGQLASEFPEATFGVGTVSSLDIMRQVAQSPHISFVVTAHWPGEEMIELARQYGKPLFATISNSSQLQYSGDLRIVGPGTEGTQTLSPQRLEYLRNQRIETAKIFDLGKIVRQRASSLGDVDTSPPASWAAVGLLAIAEAILDSSDQPASQNSRYYTMTTGGVTLENLPYLVSSVRHNEVECRIRQFAKNSELAENVLQILKQTTIIAGGTFLTKSYDEIAISNRIQAIQELERQTQIAVRSSCAFHK